MSSYDNTYCLSSKDEIEKFMERCMVAAGSCSDHAKMLAECLVEADYRGHYSHGLNRLEKYVNDVKEGITNSVGEPAILKETLATAFVSGNDLLGPVVGNFCMALAMKKAKEMGIGFVVAKHSTHFGIAGFYSTQALKERMIGITMCNTTPIAFPTRSSSRSLGSNPISLAAPGLESDSFVLDMATTTVSFGKLEILRMQNKESLPMPSTWGADRNGKATNDLREAFEGQGSLFPLGGSEQSGGYKGYGLMFLVEILTGILSDSNYGPNIRKWGESDEKANIGQCFIAINLEYFADNFEERLQLLMDHCRNSTSIEVDKPVLVAGDPERQHMKVCDAQNGISYHINQIKNAEKLAKDLNVEPLIYRSF